MLTRHIVFGSSAGGTLMNALRQAGRSDDVFWLPDNLSFGPIDPLMATLRDAWNRDVLGYDDAAAQTSYSGDEPWEELRLFPAETILWVHRRCAREYANYLEAISRLKPPVKVIETTHIQTIRDDGTRIKTWSTGHLSSKQILSQNTLDQTVTLSDRELALDLENWRELKAENAPVRIIVSDRLKSSTIDIFDNSIMALIGARWTKSSRIMNEVEQAGPYAQVEEFFLWSRMKMLIERGDVESQGSVGQPGGTLVRKRDLALR